MIRLFIAANSMVIGGIEKSLINFLNTINYSKVDVTLMLENKIGPLLKDIPKNVKIIEYKPLKDGNILIRKIKNRIKYINFIYKNKNKFDASICYASYIKNGASIVRKICKNNYMWIHLDYTMVYNKKEFYNFIKTISYNKFRNLIFVSKNALNNYTKFNKIKNQNYIVCPNFIDGVNIIKKSLENIDYKKDRFTFINVSRHEESSKRITRIIEACNVLKNEYDFYVLLIGDGDDTNFYKELVKKYNLEDIVIFLGAKKNPFPYLKISDAFILTSEYEGGPMTIYESLTLNVPVISTDVGDVKYYINDDNGILIKKSVNSLVDAMKVMLKTKYEFNFDYNKYNNEITNTIKKIIGDSNEV